KMTYAVDIVIVNWNAGDALVQCVTSIAENTANLVRRIIIVDNASSDGSIEALPQISGIELVIIRNPENRGFSVACNQGAIRSSSDYLLFLNPDTLLKTNSLAPAVAFISNSQHARIGVVGVRLLDERGRTQRSCARFPTAAALLGQAAGFDRLFPSSKVTDHSLCARRTIFSFKDSRGRVMPRLRIRRREPVMRITPNDRADIMPRILKNDWSRSSR
ncbi:Glycosyl transferase-like protein, partial [Pararhodospirillum photometricum DSM 122]